MAIRSQVFSSPSRLAAIRRRTYKEDVPSDHHTPYSEPTIKFEKSHSTEVRRRISPFDKRRTLASKGKNALRTRPSFSLHMSVPMLMRARISDANYQTKPIADAHTHTHVFSITRNDSAWKHCNSPMRKFSMSRRPTTHRLKNSYVALPSSKHRCCSFLAVEYQCCP